MLNRYTALGNLTKDPETVEVGGKYKVCKFSIAINNPIRKTVLFMDIEAWGKTGENCQKYLSKGSSAIVDGRLDSKNWQSEGGQKRSKTFCAADNVHFVRLKSQEDQVDEKPKNEVEPAGEDDDDVPF
jgi:single-strand DNA-binding protein